MKRLRKSMMLVCSILAIAACTENITVDNDVINTTRNGDGEEVQFGVSGNFDVVNAEVKATSFDDTTEPTTLNTNDKNPTTRVHFNPNTDEDLKIYWDLNDKITLLSLGINEKEGTSGVYDIVGQTSPYEYSIQNIPNNSTSSTYQVKTTGTDGGIKWYNDAKSHTFFGVYPSLSSDKIISIANASTNANTFDNSKKVKVTYKTPAVQYCAVEPNNANGDLTWGTNTVIRSKPDMSYFYMAGTNTNGIERNPQTGYKGQNVQMLFQPMLTTMVFQIQGPASGSVKVKGIRISLLDSENNATKKIKKNFSTKYEATFQANTPFYQKETCTNIKPVGEDLPYIDVYFRDPSRNSNGVVIPSGKSVNITAFVPPYQFGTERGTKKYMAQVTILYAGDLAESYFTTGIIGNKSGSYAGPATKLAKRFPQPKTLGETPKFLENWMSSLPDNMYISDISMPGALSSLAYRTENRPEIVQQNLQEGTVANMLKWGVRALDFRWVTRWNGEGLVNHVVHMGNHFDIGYAYDGQKRVEEAVNTVKNYLASHPREMVMIIFTPERRTGGGGDNLGRYLLQGFESQIIGSNDNKNSTVEADITNSMVQFSPNLTLGDCRGKIVVMMREWSIEDPEKISGTYPNITFGHDDSYGRKDDPNDKYPNFPAGKQPGFINTIHTQWYDYRGELYRFSRWATPNKLDQQGNQRYTCQFRSYTTNPTGDNKYWIDARITNDKYNFNVEGGSTAFHFVDYQFLGPKDHSFGWGEDGQYYKGIGIQGEANGNAGSAYKFKGLMIADFMKKATTDTNHEWFVYNVPGFVFMSTDRYNMTMYDSQTSPQYKGTWDHACHGSNPNNQSEWGANQWVLTTIREDDAWKKGKLGVAYLGFVRTQQAMKVPSSWDITKLMILNNFIREK